MQQCVSCKSTTPLVISVSRLSFWIALLDSFGQSHSKTSRLLFSRTISSINSVNHNIFGRWSICALAGHLLREFELRCKKLTARRTPPPHRWNYCIIRVVTANVRIISKLGVVTCHRNARYAAECNKSEVDFNVALGHEFNISFFARALGIPKQRFEKRNHICGPEQASDTYKKKKKNVSHALTFLIFVFFFVFCHEHVTYETGVEYRTPFTWPPWCILKYIYFFFRRVQRVTDRKTVFSTKNKN